MDDGSKNHEKDPLLIEGLVLLFNVFLRVQKSFVYFIEYLKPTNTLEPAFEKP